MKSSTIPLSNNKGDIPTKRIAFLLLSCEAPYLLG
jgi:hypothetical protein